MFRIGEFSQLTKTTIKTLRYYDEAGLLKPDEVDVWTGYRYYTTRQLYPLQRILALRQAGLSVEEVRQILSGGNTTEILLTRKAELERERALADNCLTRLTSLLKQTEEDQTMQQQATIRHIKGYTVYCREGVIPSYADIATLIQSTEAECLAANPGLDKFRVDYCFVSYLDGEYRESDIRVRYAQAVQHAGRDTANVRFETLAETDAICVYHRGAYEQLGKTYAFALNWAEENGCRITGLARECYIDGIWNKTNQEDWLTEIQLPIQKG